MADYSLFPSIIPDSDDDFADTSYTEGELERMDYDTLRSIAAKIETDDIHGRMGKDELKEALEGEERISV